MIASRNWHLLKGFFLRDVSTKYAGTLVGGLWALGQPVLLLLIYSFVFRKIFKVEFPELESHSFTAFVAIALWPWMAFQESVMRGSQSIVGNAALIKKVAFPNELLVISAVASNFAIQFAGFCAVMLVLAAAGEPLSIRAVPVVLLCWTVLFVLATVITMLLAALQVFLKDIDHLLGPAFMIAFYATPVLYPLSKVPDVIVPLMSLNPVVHVIEPMRTAIMFGKLGDVVELLPVVAALVVVAPLVRMVFVRLSQSFEDFV